jgi:mediator of RNA polymerase II transcription subunit 6
MPAGPEYVLADCQEPHLFVIRRQRRGAPGTQPVPQSVYYCLDGTIYQSPSVAAVLQARLARCLFSTRKAFEKMQSDLDPLVSTERELERATKVAARAAKMEEEEEEEGGEGGAPSSSSRKKPLIPPSLLAAPPRRLTEAERDRLRRGERVVATVLSQFPLPKQQQAGS